MNYNFNLIDFSIIGLLISLTVLSQLNQLKIRENSKIQEQCINQNMVWIILSTILLVLVRYMTSKITLYLGAFKIIEFTCSVLYIPLLGYWVFKLITWMREIVQYQSLCVPSKHYLLLVFFLAICYIHTVFVIIIVLLKLMNYLDGRRIENIHDDIEGIYNNSRSEYLNIDRINSLILRASLNPNDVCISDKEFDKIPKQSIHTIDLLENSKIHTCSICCLEFSKTEKIVFFRECKHAYHVDCIKGWLKRKPLCPNCKRNVRNEILNAAKEKNYN